MRRACDRHGAAARRGTARSYELTATEYHPNLVGQLRLLGGALRLTSQFGADLFATDIEETVKTGTGRSSLDFTGRVDLDLWAYAWFRNELGLHQHVAGKENYVSYASAIDFSLPLGVVVSPGLRTTVYEGKRETNGFIVFGLSQENSNEVFPVKYYARTLGNSSGG